MVVVSLSKEEKIAFGTYSWLRKNVGDDVNLVTLKQISLYISKMGCDFNPRVDMNLYYNTNENIYELFFKDGRKIIFDRYKFGFDVLKEKNGISMLIHVFETEVGNLDTVNVFGNVIFNEGIYNVIFNTNSMIEEGFKYGVIDYYVTDDKNKISDSERVDSIRFSLLSEDGCGLDCFNGYVSNVLSRIDLLYDNVNALNNTKYKKLEKKICCKAS